MLVGAGRITLEFHNNEKVATKTRQLEELCRDLRKHFNISALEIAEFDDPEKCVLGFAAVIPENWKRKSADSFIQTICRKIDDTAFARVTIEDWDLLAFD